MDTEYVQQLVYNIPERLRKSLYSFQKDGVLEAIKKGGRILIADEMGLGKTIQAISVAMAFQHFPILVISPAVVKFNWVDELEKWTCFEPEDFAIIEGRDDINSWKHAKFVVCTYGLFTKNSAVAHHINDHGFQTVICDESHYLKNLNAIRTTLICPLIENAKHAILLSGTPCLNRPVELYPQVSALSNRLFGTYSQYTRKFCNARRGRFGWDVSGQSNLKELNTKLQAVMIRRLKKDVLTQLPEKLRSRVFIDIMGKKAKKHITKLMENLKDIKTVLKDTLAASMEGNQIALEKGKVAHNEQRKFLMQAFHDTGVGKIPGVKKYLENFLDSSESAKCLVFAHHIDVLDGIEKGISEYRYRSVKGGKMKAIKYMRIDGQTPHHERQLNTRKFQMDPNCRVGIIGMLAGGVGITLTEASHVFFAELHWTPGIILQAEDRAHRIGQKNKVVINYLVAKNSIDEPMWSIICNKVHVTSTALEGTRTSLKAKNTKARQIKCRNGNNKQHSSKNCYGTNDASVIEIDSESDGDEKNKFGKGDVRTFISKLTKNEKSSLALADNNNDSKNNNKSLKHSNDNKLISTVLPTGWSCDMCTLLNPQKNTRCLACLTPRLKILKRNSVDVTDKDLRQNSIIKDVVGQEEGGGDDVETQPQVPAKGARGENKAAFYFNVSKYTGRIFLYSSKKEYLNECFILEDVDNYEYGKTTLPSVFRNSSVHLQEVKLFISKWRKLRSYDQQQLSSKIIKPPLLAILNREQLRKKHKTASKGINNSLLSFARYSSRPVENANTGMFSSSDDNDKVKACSNCSAPLQLITSGVCINKNESLLQQRQLPGWYGKYCSYECKKAMMVKTTGGYIRQEMFKLEKGICQICGGNMHELFCRIRRLEKPDRLQELLRHRFTVSTKAKKMTIIESPKEGDFWQVDHICPVAEGGGECDLSNFRTLCTPCHLKETKELHKRLKQKRLNESAKGTKDIRKFFSSNSLLTPVTQKIRKKESLSSSISISSGSNSIVSDTFSTGKKLLRSPSIKKLKKRVRFQLDNIPPSAVKTKKVKLIELDKNILVNTDTLNHSSPAKTAVKVVIVQNTPASQQINYNGDDSGADNDTDEDDLTIFEIMKLRELRKKASNLT
eukprot:g459.t1